MIRYALNCAAGHEFESWFRDSAEFERQARRGLIACPHCGSSRIEKALMAPNVAVKHEASPASARPVAMMGEQEREMRAFLRGFKRQIEEKAENLGPAFAEEARKIHYGEAEDRPIYGVASAEEARDLHDEGIEVLPVPVLPDDLN